MVGLVSGYVGRQVGDEVVEQVGGYECVVDKWICGSQVD